MTSTSLDVGPMKECLLVGLYQLVKTDCRHGTCRPCVVTRLEGADCSISGGKLHHG